MNILFIINHLNAGGAEKILTVVANSFSKKNHKITIAKVSHDESFYVLEKEINILHIVNKNHKPLDLIFGIKSTISEIQPDIIISFGTTMNIYSIIASKFSSVPIIVSEHTNFHRAKNEFWRKLRRLFYPFTDMLIVLTEYDYNKYDYVRNVKQIYNPLELSSRHVDIKREKIILAVGRLHKVKGFDLLLKAFANIDNSEWRLLILGDGQERSNLELLAKELKIDQRVSMPGIIKDIELYYKKASIFVLSSRAEGFPGALCEAMGYGCPSIAFNCISGPNEIINDNFDGILVEPENVKELAKQIKNLQNNPVKRIQFSKNGKKIIERLNTNTITNKWLDHIISIINKGNLK